MKKIDIHADDYGESVHTSEDILECILKGKLDSISIVPNMHCYEACEKMLLDAIPDMPYLPLLSVHINVVEGFCLSSSAVGTIYQDHYMKYSWGELFAASYLPWNYRKYKTKLKAEIKEQIERVIKTMDKCFEVAALHNVSVCQNALRIDSHQHTHMIPIVWHALLEVLEENHWDVEYIRNSKEPIGVFLKEKQLWKTYSPVNFIKNMILNVYSKRVDRYYKHHNMPQMYLWGLVMSGHMDKQRVSVLNEAMLQIAKQKKRNLEILFHPGSMLKSEVLETPELSVHALPFYESDGRRIEKEAVLSYEK